MSVWFEGSSEIAIQIQQVQQSFEDLGAHYVGVISLMPGLTMVELVAQGSDFVTLRTNEGVMRRTHIVKRFEPERVVVACDEEYEAGSKLTTKVHILDEFTTSGRGVMHRTVLSGIEAPGLLGFFYRNFGRTNTGNAFLASYKTYFENQG